jgi:Uma2 family endonuclease
MKALHWTSRDLELLPDTERYDIVDGELYVSKQPHWQHQYTCVRISMFLQLWSDQTQLGMVNYAPGVIFTDDNDVVPDLVWISQEQLAIALEADGKLHSSPELVIEVLSPGSENARRDREVKRKLYSRRGAQEYWIVDWRQQRLETYRRREGVLTLDKTLSATDTLVSPLLPGFSCQISQIFTSSPKGRTTSTND